MQQKRHTSYSITSVLLLILGIIFGGMLISLQKATEVLIPFESTGSGQNLSLPIAAIPSSVDVSHVQGSLLASNVVGDAQAKESYNRSLSLLQEIRGATHYGQLEEDLTTQWSGIALCNGVPLSGVYTPKGRTGDDGRFTISLQGATLLYHPTYGYIEHNEQYDALDSSVDFCSSSEEPQFVIEHSYLTTPSQDQIVLSLLPVQRGVTREILNTVYLQCWNSDGENWYSIVDGVKTLTQENKGLFSLFSVTKDMRSFACRVAPVYNGQVMDATWLTSPGVGEVHSVR